MSAGATSRTGFPFRLAASLRAGASLGVGNGGAWLRAGVLACCALGALGLVLSGRLSPRPALRVLDVSASMGGGARGPAGAFQAPGERLLFADGVRWAARGDEAADLPRGRTRLAQALTEAATRFPRGPGRVWLVTDGRDTEGGALDAAAALAARGVAVDVSAPEPLPADVGLVAARIVGEGGGGALVVHARVESSTAGRVRVALFPAAGSGGALDAREATLFAGVPVEVELRVAHPAAADSTYVVTLAPLDGTPDDDPENDRLALAAPDGFPRVVFLDAAEAAAAAAGAYGDLGGVVPRPALVDEIDAADAIVVSDLPARRLGRGGAERLLRRAARGGVVVALGGPESFGPGGWAGTTFESMLPLKSPSPDEGETAVVLCLDASGSTGETPAGGASSSRESLIDAAATLLEVLPAGARVAVLPFREVAFPEPLPPAWTAASDSAGRAALLAAVRATAAEGGTDLPAAIVAGARLAASRASAKRRVVLVATDGDPDHAPSPAAYARARAALAEAGAEAAAVVRGDAPAADALRDLTGDPRRVALIGAAGEFADSLARVFHQTSRGREVVEGAFSVRAAPGSEDDAASLSSAAPRRAHVLEAAPGARVLAVMQRAGDPPRPFAAVRTIGAGFVGAVAWGPALEDPAGKDAARRALGPFLARLARRGDRGLVAYEEGSGVVVLAPAGLGALSVRRGESGEPAALIETAPGVYRGEPPFDALETDAAPVFAEVARGTWRPLRGTARPPAEHRGVGVDGAALLALARAGGGRRLAPGEAPGPSRAPSTTPVSPVLLAVAVALFVAERARASRSLAEAARGGADAWEAA